MPSSSRPPSGLVKSSAKKKAPKTSRTLMGVAAQPSADGTEELSAIDLEQAEEILGAPKVAAPETGLSKEQLGRARFPLGGLRKPQVRELAAELQPQVLYMPSVGMFPLTLFLVNLRLAPLQVAALWPPATTGSKHIDYISVEEDFVGNPACFDEKLLLLPSDGQPYRPSAISVELSLPERCDGDEVAIAIAATTMKKNSASTLAGSVMVN